MRSTSTVLLFLSILLLFTGCKKDKDPDQTVVNKLQGAWEATTDIQKVYEKVGNKLISEKTTPIEAGQQLIVYKENEATFYENGKVDHVYTFTIRGNRIRLRTGNEGVFYQLNFSSDIQHSYIEEQFYTDKNKVEMKSVSEIVYHKK